jgi:hypothetical protein
MEKPPGGVIGPDAETEMEIRQRIHDRQVRRVCTNAHSIFSRREIERFELNFTDTSLPGLDARPTHRVLQTSLSN